MFDRHVYIQGGGSHHHTVSVTEKRAPTDESVRLLKEFEEKAQDKILKSIRLENTPIDCVIHHMQDDLALARKFVIQYRVKGKEVRVRKDIQESFLGKNEQREEIAKALISALAESIAIELLSGVKGLEGL